jgi:hypothetical protein
MISRDRKIKRIGPFAMEALESGVYVIRFLAEDGTKTEILRAKADTQDAATLACEMIAGRVHESLHAHFHPSLRWIEVVGDDEDKPSHVAHIAGWCLRVDGTEFSVHHVRMSYEKITGKGGKREAEETLASMGVSFRTQDQE